MDYVRRKFEVCYLKEETFDPEILECFGNVEENCAGDPLYTDIPGYSFNEAGHLQGHTVPGCKPKSSCLASVRVRLLHLRS